MFSHTIIKSNDYKRMMVCAECGSLVEEQTTAELASGNPKSVSYQTWLKTRKGELHEL
jgi:uncharacterized Zn finger protein